MRLLNSYTNVFHSCVLLGLRAGLDPMASESDRTGFL